jgi:hypothetical protein
MKSSPTQTLQYHEKYGFFNKYYKLVNGTKNMAVLQLKLTPC